MEESINLKNIYKIIRKNFLLIVITTVISIFITAIISYFVLTPVYEMSTEILVNQNSSEEGQLINQNIQTDLQLINTYSGIIKSPVILDQVLNGMNLEMTSDELEEKITVSNDEQSQIVNIAVQDENPEVAVKLANTIATVFEKNIKNLMNVDNVTILSAAVLKKSSLPIFPNPKLNMAIATIIGLMLGVGIAFLREHLDTTMKDQQDMEDILGVPMLGVISPIVEKSGVIQKNKVFSKGKEEISNGQEEKSSAADST
ncbi:Wzz/FepE/Etk N-terminal domain-containing protein [Planococcus liqunii]|uniref:Wzz/FepE/Etk N-terminal domain-containing protein n=1 Tax=Planococcus liqunii TaxID=3058394 RepID=A0ABT8MNG0_9BACL|nr:MULTISPECIES: Wzz/FepE/Etk N-terminal domain-containing protein [unclassified Planococcus (in: firmicutes)]MDN7226411.1 Wzz/FepE/Etk N-terminal domain-containing protein [Planococcus sp. N064]WKA50184.1 Wzz/FepE/Etk N-terminal domain-containing protein [Planococcus sp. N056]